mmetsp:Transcript_101536/g.160561  ORF Transcript_101536/g.160561 Transcript_101536/m.160561 type:complete len:125 (+) Transcript_101536:3-377(+)
MGGGEPVLAGQRASASPERRMKTDSLGNAEIDNLRTCAPRLMPVNFPAPLGPKLFIFGEPLLQKYYTVYDWSKEQVGFAVAASAENKRAVETKKYFSGDETWFMQVTLKVKVHRRLGCGRVPLL